VSEFITHSRTCTTRPLRSAFLRPRHAMYVRTRVLFFAHPSTATDGRTYERNRRFFYGVLLRKRRSVYRQFRAVGRTVWLRVTRAVTRVLRLSEQVFIANPSSYRNRPDAFATVSPLARPPRRFGTGVSSVTTKPVPGVSRLRKSVEFRLNGVVDAFVFRVRFTRNVFRRTPDQINRNGRRIFPVTFENYGETLRTGRVRIGRVFRRFVRTRYARTLPTRANRLGFTRTLKVIRFPNDTRDRHAVCVQHSSDSWNKPADSRAQPRACRKNDWILSTRVRSPYWPSSRTITDRKYPKNDNNFQDYRRIIPVWELRCTVGSNISGTRVRLVSRRETELQMSRRVTIDQLAV